MPRRSKVDLLPNSIREDLEQRLIKCGFSCYRELSKWLFERGFEISKSSLHTWGQSFEERVSALKRITAQARAIVTESPDDDGSVNEALLRLTQERVFSLMMDLELDLAPAQLTKVTKAVADLARASVSQKRLMSEIRRRDFKKLDAAVTKGTIDADAATRARRILGFE